MNSKAAELLEYAASRKSGDYRRISVRDLLACWDAKRRGYWIVEEINQDLTSKGLATDPPFTEGWIDTIVALVPLTTTGREKVGIQKTADVVEATDQALPEVSLRIGSLPSANTGVIGVTPQDSLEKAQALMMRHDFSQLAVLSGPRDLRGAISWESIAQSRIRNPHATLAEAIIPSEVIRADADLLEQIPKIVKAGFVFVQQVDRTVSGIVTTADLSDQFASLAKPFFVLAEIERRLRRVIDRVFAPDELKAAANPADTRRQVRSAKDMTVGEYVRLLEEPDRWSQLSWTLDRQVFIGALEQVRQTRNDVMHFSPDPLDKEQVDQMETFLKWLRRLDPQP